MIKAHIQTFGWLRKSGIHVSVACSYDSSGGESLVNSCELTASITAIANALACKLTEDEVTLLGVTLTQLGDTLLTIAAQRSICSRNCK